MVHCRANVQPSKAFIPNTEKLLLWDLKWKEEKQINFPVASEWKIEVYEILKPFSSFNCCEKKVISVLSSVF